MNHRQDQQNHAQAGEQFMDSETYSINGEPVDALRSGKYLKDDGQGNVVTHTHKSMVIIGDGTMRSDLEGTAVCEVCISHAMSCPSSSQMSLVMIQIRSLHPESKLGESPFTGRRFCSRHAQLCETPWGVMFVPTDEVERANESNMTWIQRAIRFLLGGAGNAR